MFKKRLFFHPRLGEIIAAIWRVTQATLANVCVDNMCLRCCDLNPCCTITRRAEVGSYLQVMLVEMDPWKQALRTACLKQRGLKNHHCKMTPNSRPDTALSTSLFLRCCQWEEEKSLNISSQNIYLIWACWFTGPVFRRTNRSIFPAQGAKTAKRKGKQSRKERDRSVKGKQEQC